MKNGFLLGFAIFIDFVQLLLGLAIIALQVLPFVGQAASTIAAGVDVVISFTFGAALIVALIFTGDFSWGAVLGGSLVETIPFLDAFAPGWSLMVWRCISNKKQEAKAKERQVVSTQSVQAAPQNFADIRPANDNAYEYQAAA